MGEREYAHRTLNSWLPKAYLGSCRLPVSPEWSQLAATSIDLIFSIVALFAGVCQARIFYPAKARKDKGPERSERHPKSE